MARITEEASATVNMNMEPARKSFEEWTAAVEKGKKELAELLALPQKEQNKKQSQISKVKEDIAHATNEADKAKKKLETFQDTLKSLNTSSFNALIKASKELEAHIKKLAPGTQEYIAANHDLKMVNTRLKDLREGWKAVAEETNKSAKITKESVTWIRKVADGFQKYWSMFDVAMRSISGISMKFRQCAEDAAKLDDVYADVMKTTGLLHEEVQGLDEELMKIDTRTSREQLLLLARDAGKLGIQGKQDILGFVRAADQIQVALGEDLGEGAIKNLGKIADVFGLTKEMGIEQSLLSIASAVNALGQASTASEAYLVDFTQRLAGVGAMAGLSVQDILGFASGLDQSAMKVEMAATAFQKFLMKMYEDTATFAGYAGMEVSKFSELLKTDANAAITTVMKAMNGKDGFATLVPMFDQMGLDGARAVTVLASMTQNLEAVTEAQRLANEEFAKGTSVTEEYNTKNNNLQAQLEKARKEFKNASITLGQSLNPIMLKSTKATTYLIKALAQYGKEIKTVLIVIAALTVALKAKVIWMKVVATWNATLKSGSYALAGAQALLAGNVGRAAAAWRVMNTVMKASVIGVVTAAVAGLIIWLQRLGKETEKLTELEKFEKKLTEDVAKATSDEAARVKALKSIVEDSNQAYQERKLALQELKRIVPDYHADLTEEGVLINNNADALDNYINKMLQAAKAQVLQDRLRENANKQFEQQQYLTENAPAEFKDVLGEWRYSYTEAVDLDDGSVGYITHWISKDCEEAISKLKEFKDEEELILKMIRDTEASSLLDSATGGSGNGGGGGGLSDKEAKKAFDKRIKELQKQFKTEERELRVSLLKREISEAEYDARVYSAHMENLRLRLEAARQYGQDTTDIQNEFLDMQIKAMEKHQKEEEKILDAFEKVRRAKKKKELEDEKKQLAADAKLMADEQEILEQNLADAKALINESNWKEEYDFEKWKLDQLHDLELLSEEDHQKALLNLKLSYAQPGADKVAEIASQASNFVTALREAESAQLEAQYQAQLTAAGDNAEKMEQIEAEYEEKKLDLQKKYADAEMVINIAKTIASGASAAIKAYQDGGPYAGPALAALIAATTAAEVATIVAQRNAIKNSSAYKNGGTGSSPMARTLNDGYAEGGYTENHTTLTTVGEKGMEWVAPHWMLRRNPVVFANLERYRKAGSHGSSGSIARGFAEGGFTGGGNNASSPINVSGLSEETAKELTSAIRDLCENGVTAKMVYSDFKRFEERDKAFRKEISQ